MKNTKIHFLNVGHGDCTIIEHPSGRITMIDINNGGVLDPTTREEFVAGQILTAAQVSLRSLFEPPPTSCGLLGLLQSVPPVRAAELTNPVEYFLRHFLGRDIHRFILTHPDMDHIRGLAALIGHGVKILNFWDTAHQIEKSEFSRVGDQSDWNSYQNLRLGSGGAKVFFPKRGDKQKFWNHDDENGSGDGLTILAPNEFLTAQADRLGDPNAHSIVLHLNAQGTGVILGGDATTEVLKNIYAGFKGLKAYILKAPHHGRDSGYEINFLNAVQPEHVIVSVGKKPETDAHSNYARQCKKWAGKVWSTRFKGDVVLEIGGAGCYRINGEKSAGLERLHAQIHQFIKP